MFILFSLIASWTYADWTPPTNPNAAKILEEARADARAGKYEDALAKHVWFHQNALKLAAPLRGVRLSFAVGYWSDLGKVYPPAMEKLKAIRDEAGKDVREGDTNRQAFIDFKAINRELRESDKTTELFLWLDANEPKRAKVIFDVAQEDLVRAKEYRLCGKYINPDSSYQRILSLYREDIDSEGNGPRLRQYHRQYQKDQFSKSVATLVAILAINGKKADADRIAVEAVKELNDENFKTQLEQAKNGQLPSSQR